MRSRRLDGRAHHDHRSGIKYTIGWRITADAEIDGIDADQHGEAAYDFGGHGGGGLAGAGAVGAHAAAPSVTTSKEGALA